MSKGWARRLAQANRALERSTAYWCAKRGVEYNHKAQVALKRQYDDLVNTWTKEVGGDAATGDG